VLLLFEAFYRLDEKLYKNLHPQKAYLQLLLSGIFVCVFLF